MTTVDPQDRADRATRSMRASLLVCGASITLLSALAVGWRVAHGGVAGPTQLQVGLAGVALLVAGIVVGPSRLLGAALVRARAAGPVMLRPLTRRQRGALAAIVLLALSFRLTMIKVYWPDHQIVMGMVMWDADMARNLLLGRGWTLNWEHIEKEDRAISEHKRIVDPQDFYPVDDSKPGALHTLPFFAHTPGYAVWLAMSFLLGGEHRFIYSQWMQAALDSIACLLVFAIGRRLWSNTAGVVGALLYSLSPGLVYLAIQPVAAATDSFWVLLIGYGIVRLAVDVTEGEPVTKGLTAVVLGAAGGTMMNTLSFTLPLAAAGGAAVLGVWLRPYRRTAWHIAGYLVVAHALVFLLLVPWGLRNKRVYGHFDVTRQTFWQHTWETLGAIPNPWGLVLQSPTGKDAAFFVWIDAHCPAPCWPDEREAFARDYLVKNVFTSPLFPAHVARLVVKQLPGIIYVSRLPVDDPFVGTGVAGRAFGALLDAINVAVLLMWPAALFGLLVITVRRSTALAAWIGLAPTVFLVTFSLVLLIEHRKTTQGYGYLTALAGVGVAACLKPRADDR